MGATAARPSIAQVTSSSNSANENWLIRGRVFGPPLLVFFVTMAAGMWQQFVSGQQCSTFFGDSRHYLESCRQLVSLFQLPGMHLTREAIASLDYCLMTDGPILPLIPAGFFLALNKVPTPLDWQVFVMIN